MVALVLHGDEARLTAEWFAKCSPSPPYPAPFELAQAGRQAPPESDLHRRGADSGTSGMVGLSPCLCIYVHNALSLVTVGDSYGGSPEPTGSRARDRRRLSEAPACSMPERKAAPGPNAQIPRACRQA